MGARGPKPGFKKAREEAAAAAYVASLPPVPVMLGVPAVPLLPPPALTFADRNNPQRLWGPELRKLAHQRGMSHSELDRIGDDDQKIREQLRFMEARHQDEALA